MLQSALNEGHFRHCHAPAAATIAALALAAAAALSADPPFATPNTGHNDRAPPATSRPFLSPSRAPTTAFVVDGKPDGPVGTTGAGTSPLGPPPGGLCKVCGTPSVSAKGLPGFSGVLSGAASAATSNRAEAAAERINARPAMDDRTGGTMDDTMD